MPVTIPVNPLTVNKITNPSAHSSDGLYEICDPCKTANKGNKLITVGTAITFK